MKIPMRLIHCLRSTDQGGGHGKSRKEVKGVTRKEGKGVTTNVLYKMNGNC